MSSPSANLEGLSERSVLRVSAVIAVASVMARRPDAFLAPQFSWEDEPEWYQVARNFGFKSVGRVYNGYLGVPQRLAGLLVQPLPLRYVPLAFAVIAILIQALPDIYIMSERCVALHPSRGMRAVIALIYLWIPGSTDTNSNLAHVQWHLFIFGAVICCAAPPRTWREGVFDVLVLLAAGLSAPSAFFLLPVVAVRLLRERQRALWAWLVPLGLAFVAQGFAVWQWPDRRPHATLGFSVVGGARIAFNRLIMTSLVGQRITPLSSLTFGCSRSSWWASVLSGDGWSSPCGVRVVRICGSWRHHCC